MTMGNAAKRRWRCPVCARQLSGEKDEKGAARCICPGCGTAMRYVRKSRRIDIIEIYNPCYVKTKDGMQYATWQGS